VTTLGYVLVLLGVMLIALGLTYGVGRVVKPDPEEQTHLQALFAFIGSGYGVLLGILVFLALQNYNDAEEAASQEASSVTSVFEIVEDWPVRYRAPIQRGLICYGRSVRDKEWPSIERGSSTALYDPDQWARRVWRLIGALPAPDSKSTATYQVVLGTWVNRADARGARLVFADQSIPTIIWAVLYIGAAVVVILTGLFPTKRHRARMITFAGVIVVLGSVIVCLAVIQRPYDVLGPNAMRNAIQLMEQLPADRPIAVPCPEAPPLPPVPARVSPG
jgi:hypothetical protein